MQLAVYGVAAYAMDSELSQDISALDRRLVHRSLVVAMDILAERIHDSFNDAVRLVWDTTQADQRRPSSID